MGDTDQQRSNIPNLWVLENYMLLCYSYTYRNWLDHNKVPIVMGNVRCNGDDKNILDCTFSRKTEDCFHRKDTWLKCKGKHQAENWLLSKIGLLVSRMIKT